MELRLTATLEMSPHCTPRSESLTSPPHPTMNPAITTARHAMVRALMTEPKMATLNIALNTIVSDLGGRGWGVASPMRDMGMWAGGAFLGKNDTEVTRRQKVQVWF